MRKFLFLGVVALFLAWPQSASADVKNVLPESDALDDGTEFTMHGRIISRSVVRERVVNRVQVNVVRQVDVVREVRVRQVFVPQVYSAYAYAAPVYAAPVYAAPAYAPPGPASVNINNTNTPTSDDLRQVLQEMRAMNARMDTVLRSFKQ